ncbi:response regulator [Hymenobacter sp. HD11105]|jgi:CheY-like chemotaxis protein
MHTILIDDDFISVFLTEKFLRREEFSEQITSFQSPEQALEHVRQVIPDNVPDIILLDLNMPLMSGWDFLEALRPHEAQLAGRCLIYILTSSLAPMDKIRAKDYGLVAGVINKPLDRAKVQAIRAQVAESRS